MSCIHTAARNERAVDHELTVGFTNQRPRRPPRRPAPWLLLWAAGQFKRQSRRRGWCGDKAEACRRSRTAVSLGHRGCSAGLDPDDSSRANPIVRRALSGAIVWSPMRSRDAWRREDERRPVSTPLGVLVARKCRAEPGCRPGGTSPGSPWRPPHADGAPRRGKCESPPGGSVGANGTRRPPQRRRAAETVNDVKLALGRCGCPGQRPVQRS